MKLNWLNNSGFITKKLYAPFAVEKDSEYLQDLSSRYDILFKQAQGAGADKKSIDIIDEYREMILGALEKYYEADIAQCNAIIEELIQDIGDNPLAVDKVNRSRAFPGTLGSEVQFFRGRVGNPSCAKGRPAKERMNPLGACLCSNTNSLKCPVKPYQVLAPWAKGVIRSQA